MLKIRKITSFLVVAALMLMLFFIARQSFFRNERKDTDSSLSVKPYSSYETFSKIESITDLEKIDLEEVSVKKFGAKGDGVSDDTQAILDALDRTNSPVYFPAGTYLISKTITIKRANSGLFGEKDGLGKPLSFIKTEDDITMIQAEGINKIYIDSLFIHKKWIDNSVKYAILFGNCLSVNINNTDITGFSARGGIKLDSCSDFDVSNNYIHDFSSSFAGYLSSGDMVDSLAISVVGSQNGKINNNIIKNIEIKEPLLSANFYQSDGICVKSGKKIEIENNDISNVGEGTDLINCKEITLKNNKYDYMHHYGIKMINGTKDCIIEGNHIKNASGAGISLEAGFGIISGNILSNNTITDVGSFLTTKDIWHYAGIILQGNPTGGNGVTGNIIEKNTITANPETATTFYGILERESAKNNTIRDNIISDTINIDVVLNDLE